MGSVGDKHWPEAAAQERGPGLEPVAGRGRHALGPVAAGAHSRGPGRAGEQTATGPDRVQWYEAWVAGWRASVEARSRSESLGIQQAEGGHSRPHERGRRVGNNS